MIVYQMKWWGLPLLTKLYGSPFPRAILFGGFTGLGTAMLYSFGDSSAKSTLSNPFMYQIFAFVVGFAMVFRSSLSYNRFWEARTLLQTIMGRMTLFVIQVLTMDGWNVADFDTLTQEQKMAMYRFHQQMVHNTSLIVVLMLKHLRADFNLDDIYEHKPHGKPPLLDANDFVVGGQRAQYFFIKMLSLADAFDDLGIPEQPQEMSLIGGLSEEERQVLLNPVPIPELKGKGDVLRGSRTMIIYAQVQKLMMQHIARGFIKVHPPMVARLAAPLDESMAAFGQCSKLANTQFPFPWAQVVLAFLVLMAATLPFMVVAFVKELWIGVLTSWMIITTYWSLNEVAAEMEDPFGVDPNDLPMSRYSYDFNQGLLAACYQLRPPFFDDIEREMFAKGVKVMNREPLGPITPIAAKGVGTAEGVVPPAATDSAVLAVASSGASGHEVLHMESVEHCGSAAGGGGSMERRIARNAVLPSPR